MNQKIIACLIIAVLMITNIALFIPQNKASKIESEKAFSQTVTYPNSDISSLIVSRNGSHPGDPYPGANVSIDFGMYYYGTTVLLVSWDYSLADCNDSSIFPMDAEIYYQSAHNVTTMASVANWALNNSRIKGAIIDDFQVGVQSTANMSAIYSALHHEDANLSEPLQLLIAVYTHNYYKDTPNSWASIEDYIDVICFWNYPTSYGLLYPQFAGYKDDFYAFKEMVSRLIPVTFWLGIYIHYYDIGEYPLDFTREQMNVAGKIIKNGDAERYLILADFWIQHNPIPASIVRDYINDEFQADYHSNWRFPLTNGVISYSDGVMLPEPLITNIVEEILMEGVPGLKGTSEPGEDTMYWPPPDYPGLADIFEEVLPYAPSLIGLYIRHLGLQATQWFFDSEALQTVYITASPGHALNQWHQIVNIRTGEWEYPTYDLINERLEFILEKDESYMIREVSLTGGITEYSGDVYINDDTAWENKFIKLNGTLYINKTLKIQNCIIEIGDGNFNSSMITGLKPNYGIELKPDNDANLLVFNSIIEPKLRQFPFNFNRTYDEGNGTYQYVAIEGSYIACYFDSFRPAGGFYMYRSTIFSTGPSAETYIHSLYLRGPTYMTSIYMIDSLIWNYNVGPTVGMFLMPGTLQTTTVNQHPNDEPIPRLEINGLSIMGGRYGLSIDMEWSSTELILENMSIHETWDMYDNYQEIVSNGPDTAEITIETASIFDWSVKSVIPGPTLKMYYPILDNGLYILTIDNVSSQEGVFTNSFVIEYSGPWLPYRNNFTFIIFSEIFDTGDVLENVMWLLIIFLIPIAMVQTIPKLGFIAGMPISLLLFCGTDTTLFPYAVVGFLAVIVYLYKGD